MLLLLSLARLLSATAENYEYNKIHSESKK